MTERPGRRTVLFRAAGSAGGRFPLEVYVSARGLDGLPDGVYWYDPAAHALVAIGPAAGGEATTLIVTGVPWRTGWRYVERGLPPPLLGRGHDDRPGAGALRAGG